MQQAVDVGGDEGRDFETFGSFIGNAVDPGFSAVWSNSRPAGILAAITDEDPTGGRLCHHFVPSPMPPMLPTVGALLTALAANGAASQLGQWSQVRRLYVAFAAEICHSIVIQAANAPVSVEPA